MGVGPSPMRATSIPLPVSPSTSAASSAGELSERVGELDLVAGAAADAREVVEHLGLQDVAADDAEVGRRLGGLRLLDDAAHLYEAAVILLDVEDAVAVGVLARHFHHCDDVAGGLVMRLDHLRQAGLVGEDEIGGR